MVNRTIDDSWNFHNVNTKEYTHCFHAYPAMMIPQIARKLIEDYKTADTELIFDPYCGSGTTLVEAKLQGIASIGTDLNPMARLVARTKSSTYDLTLLRETKRLLVSKLLFNYDKSIQVELPHFFNINYWFSEDVIQKLAYIKHLLFHEIDPSVRDFFLVPFSETVREASYTRNSEFKLFRMEQKKMDIFNVNTCELFIKKVERNFKGYLEFQQDVDPSINADVYDFNTCTAIPNGLMPKGVDLIVTSPPYGDSFTTVAYGSFSKLSNQWLNIEDAGQIDKILMGGTKKHFNLPKIHSAELELIQLKANDYKRYQEVCLFLSDYQHSIDNVSKAMKNKGIVCYVVGNRRVKDVQIPLDYITVEFFENNGFEHLNTFVRRIPNKRMPSKNSPSNKTGALASTMINEYIVVLQKNTPSV